MWNTNYSTLIAVYFPLKMYRLYLENNIFCVEMDVYIFYCFEDMQNSIKNDGFEKACCVIRYTKGNFLFV